MSNFHVDFIVDVSASNEKNLPNFFYLVKESIQKLKEFSMGEFDFGLTLLQGGEKQSEKVLFSQNQSFTENSKEFLEALLKVKTCRGSAEGIEDIEGAIRLSLESLNERDNQLGILVLCTDCMKMPEGVEVFDFTNQTAIFHFFAFCSEQLYFNLRFCDLEGEMKQIQHVSVKPAQDLLEDNAAGFILKTLATRIVGQTIGS